MKQEYNPLDRDIWQVYILELMNGNLPYSFARYDSSDEMPVQVHISQTELPSYQETNHQKSDLWLTLGFTYDNNDS
jgi:hypothetical protein